MDIVINRLSAIEAAAVKITSGAAEEKKELEQKMKERIAAFDAETDAATQKQLADIQSRLNTEREQSLKSLQNATRNIVQAIESDYEINHDKLATEILKKMIEV